MKTDFETIMAQEVLESEEILRLTLQRTEKYNGKSFIEKYALYMGMVQILELQMKQFIFREFTDNSEDAMEKLEKKTFGHSLNILKSNNVRPDLISQLETNRDNRNNMAHSFLVDTMISTSLGFNISGIEVRELDKYILELENVILFWEWCVKHEALMKSTE